MWASGRVAMSEKMKELQLDCELVVLKLLGRQ
jgi:hypothetical protein